MNGGLAVLLGLLPAVMLAGAALVCTVIRLVRPRTRVSLYRSVALLGAAAAFTASLFELGSLGKNKSGVGTIAFGGALSVDRFHVFGTVLVCAVLALTLGGSVAYARRLGGRGGAFHALLLVESSSAVMLLGQREMVTAGICLSLLIVSTVLLTALAKTSALAAEAAMRLVLTGGVALATALLGLAFLYSASGSTDLSFLASGVRSGGSGVDPVLSTVGIALVVFGLLAVVGAPPVASWTRHLSEGAPGSVAGFCTAVGTIAGAGMLGRYAVEAFGAGSSRWTLLFDVLAAAAMLLGGLHALRAGGIRRLIADLAVVQSGFLLLAMGATGTGAAGRSTAAPTALLYMVLVAAAALVAALLVAGVFDTAGLGSTVDDFRGVGRRAPATSALLSLGLLGLAGVPPLAGFVGRLLVTEAAVDAGAAWAAAIAAIAFVLSTVAVARWITVMYAEDSAEAPFAVTATSRLGRVAAAAAASLGVLLAAFAGSLLPLAGAGATALH